MVKNWAPTNQKKILNLVFVGKTRFFRIFKKIFLKSDNCLILPLSIATQLSTNLLLAWNQFSFLDEQMNRYIFRCKSMKSVKPTKNKSINETSVSSISTDWSIQSISIKSDSPIFIDWLLQVSIAVDVTIFGTNWDNRDLKQGRRRRQWKRR